MQGRTDREAKPEARMDAPWIQERCDKPDKKSRVKVSPNVSIAVMSKKFDDNEIVETTNVSVELGLKRKRKHPGAGGEE